MRRSLMQLRNLVLAILLRAEKLSLSCGGLEDQVPGDPTGVTPDRRDMCTEGMRILVYTQMQCMDVPKCTVMEFNHVYLPGLG